ncbi:MAG: AAA family ATPase [Clostridia bacterium]|jgi:AAA15 family ATPase/GTPase|nr:AAA family ATPase [Clostridia bacterium]
MLLKKLELENFKCYQRASIPFKDLSIIVGANNAGKSCLIESLRLVSKAAQGAGSRSVYVAPPEEFDLPASIRGFYIDTKKLQIDLSVIIFFYNISKYAKITAYFFDKSIIEIYLNQNDAFAVIYDKKKNLIKSKVQAKELNINKIGILPQIGPIREKEKPITKETVNSDKDTYLSSLHFRNEIYQWKDDYYNIFKQDSEDSWFGLRINSIEYNIANSEYIKLIVQDNGFPAEIGKMGNGLQMWLQIMWFLARSKDCELIILDEPDVYMHSDMQRKILELVKARFPQVIIATHSIEIISMVEPDSILEINKKDKSMHYANDSASAQKIIDDIGGVQNLALLKLGRSKKCLFVEGKDIKYLNLISERLYGKQLDLPSIPYGGFSKIPRVYGTANLFYSETTNQVKCFALADRDYRDPRMSAKIISEAQKEHLILHVWERKEIENYFIIPEILYKLIPESYNLGYDDFLTQLNNLLDEQRDKVFEAFASQYRIDSKELDNGQQWEVGTCIQESRKYLNSNWTTLDNKISLVGGKDFLSILAKYYQDNFRTHLTIKRIIENLTLNTLSTEISNFLLQLQI